jgi:large subunit ribosomal protein L21
MDMYAVVATGGKQVKVFEGEVVRVEKLEALAGETVELGPVCLVVKDDGIVVGPDALAGAKVVCHVVGHGRDRKIRVFKRKRKKNYARTQGHRQPYTELEVHQIIA